MFFELVWTLRRAYKVPREQSLDIVDSLLALAGLEILDRATALVATELARTCGQEFADAYIVAAAREVAAENIATFNERDFRRLRAKLHSWGE